MSCNKCKCKTKKYRGARREFDFEWAKMNRDSPDHFCNISQHRLARTILALDSAERRISKLEKKVKKLLGNKNEK